MKEPEGYDAFECFDQSKMNRDGRTGAVPHDYDEELTNDKSSR